MHKTVPNTAPLGKYTLPLATLGDAPQSGTAAQRRSRPVPTLAGCYANAHRWAAEIPRS